MSMKYELLFFVVDPVTMIVNRRRSRWTFDSLRDADAYAKDVMRRCMSTVIDRDNKRIDTRNIYRVEAVELWH